MPRSIHKQADTVSAIDSRDHNEAEVALADTLSAIFGNLVPERHSFEKKSVHDLTIVN